MKSKPFNGLIAPTESIAANFEQLFSGLRDNGALAYHDVRVGLRLDTGGTTFRETATSILDTHFDTADGILNGSRRPAFQAGQSGGALTMNILTNHGLTGEALIDVAAKEKQSLDEDATND